MADVRSLLRQQRAARRIVHPHAAYSDAGKLLCTVCHEQVKAESLWDGHIRGAAHLQRAQKLEDSRPSADQPAVSNKRKHGDGDDEEMDDDVSMADEGEDGLRNKRTRLDTQSAGPEHDTEANDKDKTTPTRRKPPTPPLPRRTSGTPSQGVEIQIPSRPATPVAVRTDSAISNGTPAGPNRSPLRPQRESSAVAGLATSAPTSAPTTTSGTPSLPPPNASSSSAAQGGKTAQDVDEDEWAAFEADLLQDKTTNGTSARPGMAEAPADAVISAPAMTADELAAQSAEEERERRRATADIQLDHEKEDATRALEEEFEDMEELEARVRRLKERREALRKHQGGPPATGAEGKRPENGKENAGDVEGGEDDEDDEDEDEDADDWPGFRFKG